MQAKRQSIIDLEQRFWQSMVDKDSTAAKAMIADECLVTGPMGSMKLDPDKYAEMTDKGDWELKAFDFSDIDVIMPNDDTAVIAYKVHQQGTMKGGKMDMKCADSSTWVRDGNQWKCALHTETVLES